MNPEQTKESSSQDETKIVSDFFKFCNEGNASNLLKYLENSFSIKRLDQGTRKCLKNATINRKNCSECINHLLHHININYKNSDYDNSTIFMQACLEGNYFIIEQLSNFDFSQSLFDPEQKLNLNMKDSNGKIFLHYLLCSSIQEDDAYEIISKFISDSDYKTTYINKEENISKIFTNIKNNFEINVKECFNTPDLQGWTPIALTLSKGWFKLTRFFLMLADERYLNKIELNNYIHYSVIGKNLNCLNLILKESSLDDVRQKNIDGLNPADLAKKLDMNYFSRILENFEEHCHNSNYFNIFSDKNLISPENIFDKFIQGEYNETLFLLGQLNVLQSILETPNLSLEWNIILTKYNICTQIDSHTEKNRKDSFKIFPESILSKYIIEKDKNSSNKKVKKNFLKIFSDFFNGISSKKTPPSHDNHEAFDILIFNKGILSYKSGDDIETINIFLDYFKIYLDFKDYNYYKWVIYVNITLIIIEILLNNKYTKLVNSVIKKLEEFLFTSYLQKRDDSCNDKTTRMSRYLDNKEVLNNHTLKWDESFCLINLYKALNFLHENKINELKICFMEFKKLYKNCVYRENLPIFRSLINFYKCLKIKLLYNEEFYLKGLRKLNKIHDATQVRNINITINENKISENYRGDLYKLFYLNSVGIIYLGQKKFISAELFFKMAIDHYKIIYENLEKSEFDFQIKLTDIYLIKYNLGLCYFYQKKYDLAYKIFKEIIKNKFINDSLFIWYRIGLCILEIELNELRKLRVENTVSEYISKNYGYENNFNYNNENFTSNLDLKNNLNKKNSPIKNIILKIEKKNTHQKKNNFIKKSNTFLDKNEEAWETVKFLKENLKDTINLTNIDEKVDYVINGVTKIKENLINSYATEANTRRIVLQSNIFSRNSNIYIDNNLNSNNSNDSENESNNNYQNSENVKEENINLSEDSKTSKINSFKKLKLSEAIYCFRKVTKFIKELRFNNNNNFTNNKNFSNNFNFEEISNFYINKEKEKKYTSENYNNNSPWNNNDKFQPFLKSLNPIANSTYLTLIFSLILDKNWLEALVVLKEYEKIEYIPKDKDIKIKLNNYLVEIYVNINQIDKALEIIKQDINNSNLPNEKLNFYSSSQNQLYPDISYRIMLHSNIVKIHLMNNNIPEADRCLRNIMNIFNFKTIYEVPIFIINHIIYLNLIKDNFQIVLNLVKFKRINMNNLNPMPDCLEDENFV